MFKTTVALLVSWNCFAQDNANLDLERRLFEIYKDTTPVNEITWSELTQKHSEHKLTIRAGDTLWDLSKTLFADGFFWSKLWAENKSIENPHQISKGQSVLLIGGSVADEPSISVQTSAVSEAYIDNSGENAIVEMQNSPAAKAVKESNRIRGPVYREDVAVSQDELDKGLIEEAELIPRPEIPEEKRTKPLNKNLPKSFRQLISSDSTGEYDSTGLDWGGLKVNTHPPVVLANYWIVDDLKDSVATIIETRHGGQFAGLGQEIFIKHNGKAQLGAKLSVVNLISEESEGSILEVGGVIQIDKLVSDEKGTYLAHVISGKNPIRVGGYVISQDIPKINLKKSGRKSDVKATIIGGEFGSDRKIMGTSTIVYLSGGEEAGIRKGDLLPVQSSRESRVGSTEVEEWSEPIGVIKVIDSQKKVSTAVVLESWSEIRPGDMTGGSWPSDAEKLKLEELTE